MSEQLKSYKMIDESYCCGPFSVEPADVYLKSEADKAIADLEESHKLEVSQLLVANREQAVNSNLLRDSMEQAIRRQKYKRCINMSNWCSARSNFFFVVGRNEGGRFAKERFRRSDLYSKWYKRWLKLAEKFKEEKCR